MRGGSNSAIGRRLRAALERDVHPLRLGAESAVLREIERAILPWTPEESRFWLELAQGLNAWIGERLERAVELERIQAEFTTYVGAAMDSDERRRRILEFAEAIGADTRQLRGDRRAFSRWFSVDAVLERCRKRIGGEEWRAAIGLGRLAAVASAAFEDACDPTALWPKLDIEPTVFRALSHGGDRRLRAAAFGCLSTALNGIPPPERERLLGERNLQRVYRAALEPGPDVASQCAAIDVVAMASPAAFSRVLDRRFRHPPSGDDFWVRRHAAKALCARLGAAAQLESHLATVAGDPSAAVRQALALALPTADHSEAFDFLERLARADPAPEVRIAALLSVRAEAGRIAPDRLTGLFRDLFRTENAPIVQRAALVLATNIIEDLCAIDFAAARNMREGLEPAIDALHGEAASLPVRRWAAQAREQMWCCTDPDASRLRAELGKAASALAEGGATGIEARATPELLGRVLAVMAQHDFGFHVEAGVFGRRRLRRGDTFRFRFWRALHEFRHPSTDKRQAFNHTIGRVYPGVISAPSGIMAELAETKVPGEPYLIADEQDWRPYLPLPDHALSAIDTGQTVRLYSAEGVTEMDPPRGLFRRIGARLRLSVQFPRIAALRNWSEQRNQPPSSYLRALSAVGVKVRIKPHPGTAVDTAVSRFFPVVALPAAPELLQQIEQYFYSVYQNSLEQLGLFIGLALGWFMGRHVWISWRMRSARRALPLVLGGWGTRGKSGTERLKAAVINAVGYSLVSKTTGCEAMFLYGNAFGPVREMFLFRPYEKATIWEQTKIADLARKLGAGVFLWECMGLSPSYVRVLQRHWMRDDVSTLTNTYPDHEDLQGPAGRNIPEVMADFIPEAGVLLTTEEQMRPILADAARRLGTRIEGVGWLDAALLPSDALRRFSYEEHPFNVALVLKLADELGIDRDLAVREMADRVVPDLGVLKAYPVAEVKTRRLQFVNGCSANERFGALSNWARMGFDRQDPRSEPGVWITTVVNNRADRVPRSQVFAGILVNDISADQHVLVGGNLEGLRGFIGEAWSTFAEGLTLWPDTSGDADPLGALRRMARRMRVPFEPEDVVAILRAMLQGQPEVADCAPLVGLHDRPDLLREKLTELQVAETDHILLRLEQAARVCDEYRAFADRLASETDRKVLDADYRTLLWTWFERKIIVIEDYFATGEQIVDRIRAETPPGFMNRIMGMQNIKGTGLDFVYRWQAWDACFSACEMAEDGDPAVALEGLRALASFQEYGVLSEERVRRTLDRLQRADRGEQFQARVALARANFDRQIAAMSETLTATRRAGFGSKVVALVEAALDPGDAVRRRREANRIYRDMVSERISHERAALELKRLNSRQKGGWLAEALTRVRARFMLKRVGSTLLRRDRYSA